MIAPLHVVQCPRCLHENEAAKDYLRAMGDKLARNEDQVILWQSAYKDLSQQLDQLKWWQKLFIQFQSIKRIKFESKK